MEQSNNQTQNKYSSGQTLFELVVALGIGILMITAVVVLVTGSVKNSSFSQNNAMATRFAQEGLEWAKGEKEESWSSIFDKSSIGNGTSYCLQTLSWSNGSSNCTQIANTVLTRTITMKKLDTDNNGEYETIQATSSVTWADSNQTHDITLDTQFTDWRTK